MNYKFDLSDQALVPAVHWNCCHQTSIEPINNKTHWPLVIDRSNHGTKTKTNSGSDGVIVQAKSQVSDYKDTELSHSDTVIATRYSDFVFFLLTIKYISFPTNASYRLKQLWKVKTTHRSILSVTVTVLLSVTVTVLFHQFQIIFDQIQLTFSVPIGTIKINKCNQIQPGNYSCFHS